MTTGRHEGEAKVVERAMQDSAFRAQLMSDPKTAVAAETGWIIPADVSIRVVEETADTFYLVIPFKAGASELSDEELEDVSGGARVRCPVETWSCKCTG